MTKEKLYPFLLAPIFKEKIWGGRLMQSVLNKDLPDGKMIGESWELSDYRGDITAPVNGPLAGAPFHELYLKYPQEILGRVPAPGEVFPLLTKFIDSNQLLSLQVHPSDSYALEHDGEYGKTECWYVVYAKPGATVVRGLTAGVTREAFRRALETGAGLEEMLVSHPVAEGDFLFMPTGVVHAIGEGTIILEIEQNSDMTYRLSDWGRLGADGRPRPLHLGKGLDVTDFEDRTEAKAAGLSYHEAGNSFTHYCSCRYFSAEVLDLESTLRLDTGGGTFFVLTLVRGTAEICGENGEKVEARTGDTVFLPAQPQGATITPGHGCRIVKAYIDPTHRRFIEPLLRKGFPLEQIERYIQR
ncbi:class I mannose-6-phosphate isomerase [bacterium]|nr:class I mannose-6-phosphate isomerase [bacterium]